MEPKAALRTEGGDDVNIAFKNPGFEYSVDSILLFQTDDMTPYWSDALTYFYPEVDAAELRRRGAAGRREYLLEALWPAWQAVEGELEAKVLAYGAHFALHRPQIEAALSEAFGTDTGALFNDLTANITLNPICPRFLIERRFDLFCKNSERGALGMSLHEMIHYLWFHVWHAEFGDSYGEYETPSLKWILSEMVVENIMRDERLSSINPYFPRENGGCVYDYFQNMQLDGEPALDAIDRMYRQCGMREFMHRAYAYCLGHESAIRAHIDKEEKG